MKRQPETAKRVHMQASDIRSRSYSRLLRRFILITMACSVLPLLVVGWAIYFYHSQFSQTRMVDYFQRKVEYNRKIVELFLKERTSDLRFLASTHSLGFLGDVANLKQAFHILNRDGSDFTDLGIIGENGKHIAYVGPYDLMDKDYSQTFWFKEVIAKGVYVSDMFTGYRQTPHFIIAVLGSKMDTRWIVRATIYTEFLSSLVEATKLGESGEVFLLNKEGIYQTSPRLGGKIMDQSPLPMGSFTAESGILILDPAEHGPTPSYSRQVVAYSWLQDPAWLLVVKQDYAEVFRDLNHANTATLILLHLSILAILIVSVLTARHMIKVIKKRDEEAEGLNRQLMQASKLASIGELAAGVAHEINNPLGVILTENQVMRDLSEDEGDLDETFREQLLASLAQVDSQVQRCSHITQNLLRFSRSITAVSRSVDLNACLKDVLWLLDKKANAGGVHLALDCQADLPSLYTDPFELEQVFLNLINNAIDAHEGRPYGTISITTRSNGSRGGIEATIADTGSGISGEHLERIFDPFFTTKPPGKGTGLGLSITYNIIRHMGGDISVHSEAGRGTEFTVYLPCSSEPTEQGAESDESRKEDRDAKAQTALSG